jgi:hypothetical protein
MERPVIPVRDLTMQEIVDVVQGYPDEKLAEFYQRSLAGTEWHRILSEEIGRRDALGPGATRQP